LIIRRQEQEQIDPNQSIRPITTKNTTPHKQHDKKLASQLIKNRVFTAVDKSEAYLSGYSADLESDNKAQPINLSVRQTIWSL